MRTPRSLPHDEKEPREGEPVQGVVEWDVEIYNQDDVMVATYQILTLVAKRDQSAAIERESQ